MGSSTCEDVLARERDPRFAITRWTRVRKAGQLGTPGWEEALTELCREYWYPLYAFVRRQGYSSEDAKDLTQAFFARLLEKQYLQRADPRRGRFRTFLLSSLRHFLINEWERLRTAKRGGSFSFESWDALGAEQRYQAEPSHQSSPDRLYDQRWAEELIERALKVLREEHGTAGEEGVFDALEPLLSGGRGPECYRDAAARLGISEDAVKMRVHRMKRRLGALLREQVAETVVEETELEEEMRYLFDVWC